MSVSTEDDVLAPIIATQIASDVFIEGINMIH